jgi:hypothetical protein
VFSFVPRTFLYHNSALPYYFDGIRMVIGHFMAGAIILGTKKPHRFGGVAKDHGLAALFCATANDAIR